MKYKHLFILFMFITLFSIPVNAISCSIDKASQYALEGETVEYWGYVLIDNNEFCIFRFNNRNPSASEIIVLDKNNNRIIGNNLEKSIFSYKTYRYIEGNYPQIQQVLQEIYNEFITNSHKYNSNLDGIIEAVGFYSQFIELDIPIYANLKVDVVKSLNYLISKTNWVFNPNWNVILERYKSYKETIDQIAIAKQRGGFISYNREIKDFYKNTIAIENFVKAVDNKTGSNLHPRFGSLNFESLATKTAQDSINEVNLIEARINKKKTEVHNELTNFNSKLNELNNLIWKSLEKEIDTKKFEEKFCYYKHNKPDTTLINREQFQEFIDNSKTFQKDLQQNIDELNNLLNNSRDKFIVSTWLSKIGWWFRSITC